MSEAIQLTPSDPERVRDAAGRDSVVADLQRAVICLTGADRLDFMHRICSQDVAAMADGEGRPALLLEGKGKIRAFLVLWRLADRVLLEVDRTAQERVMRLLDMYLFTEKVVLTPQGDALSALAFLGPGAPAMVERLFGVVPPGPGRAVLRPDPLRLVADALWLGVPGVVVHARPAALAQAMDAVGDPTVASPEDLEFWRIRAGLPRIGVDTDDRTFPQEANLGDAFSVTKGCYVGQEVVARIETYGQVNRRLAMLDVDGTDVPAADTPLCAEGEIVGRVTSAAKDPVTGAVVALGFLPRVLCEEDEELTVGDPEATLGARVSKPEVLP